MLSDHHRKQLDDAIEAAGKLGGVKEDTAVLRRMVYADLEQLLASHDRVSAAFEGDWECEFTFSLECECGDGKGDGSGGRLRQAPRDDHGPLVGWGTEHCWTWGGCTLCIGISCEKSPI